MESTARTKIEEPAATNSVVRVRAVSGPGPRISVVLGEEPLTIGTSGECGLRLSDPNIAARHARMDRVPDGVVFRDLGSSSGSFVRGLRADTIFLPFDTPVTIGGTQLVLSSSESLCLLQSSPARSFLEKDSDAQRFLAPLDLAAAMHHSVLLVAEDGRVAEFVAANLHAASDRHERPLVMISCAADSESELELEIFGGRTAADGSRLPGALELARGGTLLLSACQEANPALIEALAMAVTSGRAKASGSDEHYSVDVRVVFASTARQPWHWTPAGQAIARTFRSEALAIPRSLSEHFKVFLTPGGSPDPAPAIGLEQSYAQAKQEWVAHFEREFVRRALSETAGNVADAARRARMDRAYLFRLIRKHGLRDG